MRTTAKPMVRRDRHRWRFAATATAMLLSGCASEASRQRIVMAEIVNSLPGRYDNLAQIHSEETAAGSPHLPLALLILPLQTPVLGSAVLYVRETPADDSRRVLAQRIWSFLQDKKGRVLQMNYVFKDPQRWQRVVEEPDLLQSVTPEDLALLVGCELIWTKTGSTYAATDTASSCRPGSASEGLLVEQRAHLSDTQLSITEQQVGSGGVALANADTGLVYQFQKSGASTTGK